MFFLRGDDGGFCYEAFILYLYFVFVYCICLFVAFFLNEERQACPLATDGSFVHHQYIQ